MDNFQGPLTDLDISLGLYRPDTWGRPLKEGEVPDGRLAEDLGGVGEAIVAKVKEALGPRARCR